MFNPILFNMMTAHAIMLRGAGAGIFEMIFKWILRGFALRAGWKLADAVPVWILVIIVIVLAIWYFKSHHNDE